MCVSDDRLWVGGFSGAVYRAGPGHSRGAQTHWGSGETGWDLSPISVHTLKANPSYRTRLPQNAINWLYSQCTSVLVSMYFNLLTLLLAHILTYWKKSHKVSVLNQGPAVAVVYSLCQFDPLGLFSQHGCPLYLIRLGKWAYLQNPVSFQCTTRPTTGSRHRWVSIMLYVICVCGGQCIHALILGLFCVGK